MGSRRGRQNSVGVGIFGSGGHRQPAGGSVLRLRKKVLTTGEVARICNVAPRTVSKWFDAGHLRGYRIPGSKDRRIPLEQLLRFMRAHGIPFNGLDTGATRVLVFDADAALCQVMETALCEIGGYEVASATSALEAGARIQERRPDVIVVDVKHSDAPPGGVARFVHGLGTDPPVTLIGIGGGLTDAEGQALLQQGFDGYLAKPFSISWLIRLIEEKTAVFAAAASSSNSS